MTNLKAARIIEVGTPEQYAILIRTKRGDPFTRIGRVEQGEVEVEEIGHKLYEDDMDTLRVYIVTILAEFPVTLADLLPEGCTRFMWRDRHMDVCYAERNSGGQWSVSTDYAVTYSLDDLDALVNYATVVPLQVHPDYVEARR